jgi:lysozyme
MHATLTVRAALALAKQEAIVREWYLDSENVGTWGIGVTNASGHNVDRYRNNPQSIERCLEVYLWLIHTRYLPDVEKAFAGHDLTENELAAALSFHYNTGAIENTSWVKLFLAGQRKQARIFLETHYLNGGALSRRRRQEAALFFDGTWPGATGTVLVYPVRKPNYKPDFSHPQAVDIRADMEKAMAA